MSEQDRCISAELLGSVGTGEIDGQSTGGDIEATERDRCTGPSPLFLRLMATVDLRHLVVNKIYLRLVSEIAELLPDEEIALLALYFAPPLRVRFHRKNHVATTTNYARQKGVS